MISKNIRPPRIVSGIAMETLRDTIAISALQGLIQDFSLIHTPRYEGNYVNVAIEAYRYADAMLQIRKGYNETT